jgi:hypothetical protein
MITTTDPLTAARAAALYVSDLSATDHHTHAAVEAAIRHSLRTRGGSRGCAADVAASYGDYPELAAPRMRWARSVVEHCYRRSAAPAAPALIRSAAPVRRVAPARCQLAAAA